MKKKTTTAPLPQEFRLEEVEEYHALADVEDSANPLVAAFPQFSYDTIATLMTNGIGYSEAARLRGEDDRIGQVMKLSSFFFPVPTQIDFGQRLWSLILQGYRKRNPHQRRPTKFSALMSAIKAGNVQPTQDCTAMNSMSSAVLIGTPGTGKTTTLEMFLRHFNRVVLQHKGHPELYQLVYIKVEAPKGGSARSLARRIYTELLAAARAVPGPMPFRMGATARTTEDEFKEAIVVLAAKLNLGLLVLDELQHLFKSSTPDDDGAMKFLTELVNDLRIPVLMIGTWQCEALLCQELRLARRGTGPADAKFRRMPQDEFWDEFLNTLFANQYLRNPFELTDEIKKRFYYHTQGIQDLAVKLCQCCQIEAILQAETPEEEQITMSLIDEVFEKHFTRVSRAVSILRDGRAEEDPKLWDLEFEDQAAYLRAFAANARTRLTRSERKANHRFRDELTQARADAVAASLEATGSVAPGDAEALAQSSVDAAPHKPAVDHVEKILRETRPKAARPSKSASMKRSAEIDAEIDGYDDADVRKAVYVAHKAGTSVEHELHKRGLWTALSAEPL